MARETEYASPEMVSAALLPASRIRTLVVDDCEAVMDVICALLALNSQIEIVGHATNGIEALEAALECNPDLVLMDIEMPLLNGIDAARILARQFPLMKVVLMSAVDSPKVRQQCEECGADGFAYKVTFTDDFSHVLQNMLSQRCCIVSA